MSTPLPGGGDGGQSNLVVEIDLEIDQHANARPTFECFFWKRSNRRTLEQKMQIELLCVRSARAASANGNQWEPMGTNGNRPSGTRQLTSHVLSVLTTST